MHMRPLFEDWHASCFYDILAFSGVTSGAIAPASTSVLNQKLEDHSI
jgi:hypothetical protein